MKNHLQIFCVMTAGLLIAAGTGKAEEVTLSGTSCWAGTVETQATSQTDLSYAWRLGGTNIDDTGDAEKHSYFKCWGVGAFIGGERQGSDYWCQYFYANGDTAMARGKTEKDTSSRNEYVAGTGKYEGVTGEVLGEPRENVGKPPSGEFAACQKYSGKLKLKN